VKITLLYTPLGELNLDGITELTEGEVLDWRDMRANEGDLFRQVPVGFSGKERSFQLRSGCKSLSPTPTHGRDYLRNPQRVVGDGEKVDFFYGRGNTSYLHLHSTASLGRPTFDCPSETIPEFELTPPSRVEGLLLILPSL